MVVTLGSAHMQTRIVLAAVAARARSCWQRTWTHRCCTWNICHYPADSVWRKCPEMITAMPRHAKVFCAHFSRAGINSMQKSTEW